MQATTSNDEKTNRAILNEVKQAMQRRIDKQEYIVNAIDNGIKPLQAETMFNKEERQKQIDRNKQNKNNQAQPQQNKQPMQGQNSYTTKGGYSYTVVE
jgi:predicted transcriptional regulator